MKHLITLLLVSITISVNAQISITTRLDSLKAINDRQITTSVPPNLVYPVQVGSKTDSLCNVVASLVDTVNSIVGTSLGLQAVTATLDTTNIPMTVGNGTYQNVISSNNISTLLKSGGVLEDYLGMYTGSPSLYLKDNSSSNGFFIKSGPLTSTRTAYLPDEPYSGSGVLRNTFLLHYSQKQLTIDNPGTGDSTEVGQGIINTFAPPVSSYLLNGQLFANGLFFGQINAGHTHRDGMTVYFGADGTNYYDTIANKSGTFALKSDIIASTPTITATYIAYGGTVNQLTGSADMSYDGSTVKLSPSSVSSFSLKNGSLAVGDLGAATNGAKFNYTWSGTHLFALFSENTTNNQFFIVNPNTGIYGLGDGVNSSTQVGNGTQLALNDAAQTAGFGDMTASHSGMVVITDNGASDVYAGDYFNTHNHTYMDINDGGKKTTFNSGTTTATGAIAFSGMQVATTTGTVTIAANVRGLYLDPPSLLASATIKLPTAVDGQEIIILFGGTITSGAVVTSLTINGNGGTLIGTPASSAVAGTVIRYKYRLANTSWYPN